jgi:hypothetical protein
LPTEIVLIGFRVWEATSKSVMESERKLVTTARRLSRVIAIANGFRPAGASLRTRPDVRSISETVLAVVFAVTALLPSVESATLDGERSGSSPG